MGMGDTLPDDTSIPCHLRLVRLPWIDGDYIPNGCYYGGSNGENWIYYATGDAGDIRAELYVRAVNRLDAKTKIRAKLPKASFVGGGVDQSPVDKLTPFELAYVTAALWSSNDDSTGDPLDDKFGPKDITRDTLAAMVADCVKFQADNAVDLAEYYRVGGTEKSAGGDFWLTRNHHGSGYWDDDKIGKDLGERLTVAAQKFREVNLWVTSGGKVRQD